MGVVIYHVLAPAAGDFFCTLAGGQLKIAKKGELPSLQRTGEPLDEIACLSRGDHVRGAVITVMKDAEIISVPTRKLVQASDTCLHKSDRALMEILVENLSMANLRLSGL
jgi:hypothetical protein